MSGGHRAAARLAWDVVRVPFPYTNRPIRQRRPALAVTFPLGDDGPGLVWVLMITSAENRGWSGDVEISDLLLAGLPAPSIIRTEKIATVEALETEAIGRLAPADQFAVVGRLRDHLAAVGLR